MPEIIADIKLGISSIFLYLCHCDKNGNNLSAYFFFTSVFHCFVNPQSKFVTIKSLNSKINSKNPFYLVFNSYLNSEKFIGKKCENITLSKINIFASYFIVDLLGSFDFSIFEDCDTHSNIFTNIKLDQLIFSHTIIEEKKINKCIVSSKPFKENNLSIMYFKTDIIDHNDQSNYSPLATIPIPVMRENPIIYEPYYPIYLPIKKFEVREINFLLTDEKNNKLNLTNGNLNFTLEFKSNE